MADSALLAPTVEADLMRPLLDWLRSRRQVREDAVLVEEFPWHGRRVDLALLTRSGLTASYELKLAHNRRAIEQSYLNSVAFDRSYLVTATRPSLTNLEQAKALGVGVILISMNDQRISLHLAPQRLTIHPRMRAKLQKALAARSGADRVR